MKKLLLLFLFISGFAVTKSTAQMCTPDRTLVDSVVALNYLFPPPLDTATMIGGFEDTTCIGVYFETTLNFVIPTEIEFNGTTLPVVNIKVDNITGLPAGINYVCTPSSCDFRPIDTVACVLLYGIVEDGVSPGDFELGIEGTANVGFTLPLSTLINAGGGGAYYLFVRDTANTTCLGVATENPLATSLRVQNNPNPFSYFTNIEIASELSGDFDFQVVNMLGATIHRQAIRINEGLNQIEFDGSDLAEGVYFYSISSKLGQLSGKMMINR